MKRDVFLTLADLVVCCLAWFGFLADLLETRSVRAAVRAMPPLTRDTLARVGAMVGGYVRRRW